MDETVLLDRARELLGRLGPMHADAIARELDDPDVDAQVVFHALIAEPEDPEGFAAFPLRDGRFCDLDQLLEGIILTHELSDEERDNGKLQVDPDLMIVHLLSDDGRTFPLADGTHATFVDWASSHLEGPEGWLPEARAVELTIVDDRIVLTGRDDVPEVEDATVDRLDAVLAVAEERGWNLDGVELIVQARARYPRIFTRAQAPVSDLLAAAGLRMTDRGIVDLHDPDDLDAGEDRLDGLVDHLRDDHGFDESEIGALLELHRTTLEVSNSVLRASIDRITTSAGEPDDDRGTLDELIVEALEEIDLQASAEQLFALLDDRDLTAAILEDLVGSDPIVAAVALALTENVVADLRDRRSRANAAWLASGCLELVADDHALAERQLRKVVELDPDNASATFELARYLSDRGEAGAALNLLRQIEGPKIDEQIELLSRYTKPGPASAGRNDPCPCGSGRKHKVCCQARNGWPLQERIPWVWNKVYTYLASPAAHELVSPIVQAIDLTDGPDGTGSLAATSFALFEGGLLEELCERRGSLLPADELELLRTWAEVRAAAYELVGVDRDDRLTLLDLTSGERVSFVDHRMAGNLDVGDAFLAWMLEEPDGSVPHYGVIRLRSGHLQATLELLDEDPSVDDLIGWYRSLTAPPRLATTAGDPLETITQVYAVPDVAAAGVALAAHLEEVDDGRLAAFEERDGQRWLRGSVALDVPPGHLTVSTLSAHRAAWFNDLVDAEVVGAELVDEERIPADDIDARIGPGPFDDGSDSGAGAGLDLDAMDPQQRAVLEDQLDAFMAEHEDRWLETSIPALGGATPREAAQDPTRRADLDTLLKEMENLEAGWTSPGRPMDGRRLRRLLDM